MSEKLGGGGTHQTASLGTRGRLLGIALLAHGAINVTMRAQVFLKGELLVPAGGGDAVHGWLAEAVVLGLTGVWLLFDHRWALRFGAGALALLAVAILDSHLAEFSRWSTRDPVFHRVVLTSWLPWGLEAGAIAASALLLGTRARRDILARARAVGRGARPTTVRHYVAAALVGVFLFFALLRFLAAPWTVHVPPDRAPIGFIAGTLLDAGVQVLVLWCVWIGLWRGSSLALGVVAGSLIWEPAYRFFAFGTGAPWLDPNTREMLGPNAAIGVPFLLLGVALCVPLGPRRTMLAPAP